MHERKVRDGEDTIASTRDACAPQNERLALRKDSRAGSSRYNDRDYPFAGTGGGGSQSKKEEGRRRKGLGSMKEEGKIMKYASD